MKIAKRRGQLILPANEECSIIGNYYLQNADMLCNQQCDILLYIFFLNLVVNSCISRWTLTMFVGVGNRAPQLPQTLSESFDYCCIYAALYYVYYFISCYK